MIGDITAKPPVVLSDGSKVVIKDDFIFEQTYGLKAGMFQNPSVADAKKP
jgi:hypothetical protein